MNNDKKFNSIVNTRTQMSYEEEIRENERIKWLEWNKRQAEYFLFALKKTLRFNLKKGEIYEFDFGINVHAEISYRHYGLVMADSSAKNPLVIVCPLKTNKTGGHSKSDVDLGIIKELNPKVSTLAVINQVRTLDKLRIFSINAIGTNSNKPDLKSGEYVNGYVNDNEDYDEEIAAFKNGKKIYYKRIPRLDKEKMEYIEDAYFNYLKYGD